MSGHEDAPAIKLFTNKKEQEKYENLAGLAAPLHSGSENVDGAKYQLLGSKVT